VSTSSLFLEGKPGFERSGTGAGIGMAVEVNQIDLILIVGFSPRRQSAMRNFCFV
jgi:hypothetical protein